MNLVNSSLSPTSPTGGSSPKVALAPGASCRSTPVAPACPTTSPACRTTGRCRHRGNISRCHRLPLRTTGDLDFQTFLNLYFRTEGPPPYPRPGRGGEGLPHPLSVAPLPPQSYTQFVGRGDYEERGRGPERPEWPEQEDPYGRLVYRGQRRGSHSQMQQPPRQSHNQGDTQSV